MKANLSQMTDNELFNAQMECKTRDEYYTYQREMNRREREKRRKEEAERFGFEYEPGEVEVEVVNMSEIEKQLDEAYHSLHL